MTEPTSENWREVRLTIVSRRPAGTLQPRHNALLKSGQKSDKIDARRLAELLRATSWLLVGKGRPGRDRSDG
jgi:hypothetical protein